MRNLIEIISESEKSSRRLEQKKLDYSREDLAPVMSKETLDYHFGKLAKTYVDRYNKGEGDKDFNEAGAVLHNIYFEQFCAPNLCKGPADKSLEFINKHFTSYQNLKDQFEKNAMSIQGSGWVYLSTAGTIKTIKNHQIKNDIILLIDWWEHAWALDYQHDKSKYLKNIWKIIDWKVIDNRL